MLILYLCTIDAATDCCAFDGASYHVANHCSSNRSPISDAKQHPFCDAKHIANEFDAINVPESVSFLWQPNSVTHTESHQRHANGITNGVHHYHSTNDSAIRWTNNVNPDNDAHNLPYHIHPDQQPDCVTVN